MSGQDPQRRDAICGFNCFLVQKVSHNGTLYIYQGFLQFAYASGEESLDTKVPFDQITEIVVETRLTHAMNNLELRCKDQTLLFTGLHEAQVVKDLVELMREHKKDPQPTYGFQHTGEKTVQWEDLPNPILLCSNTLPGNLQTVLQLIEQKDTFYAFYESNGNEEINMSEWVPQDGYRERVIQYNKWVVLPVLGKNLIKIVETQRLFQLDGKLAIAVISDLGKTPYAKCFDPMVQIFFVDNGDKVEYMVKFEMFWSSEPFVKNIIQTKTTDEIKGQYTKFGQQLVRELGGSDADEDADKQEDEEETDDFTKTRKIYKIVIISLLALLLLIVLLKYGKRFGIRLSAVMLVRVLTIAIFMALLIFF